MALLLPPCPSREHYQVLVDQAAPWLPAVGLIARRHGLPPPTLADHRPGGFVVFALGPCVLKLTPRWYEAEVLAERVALGAVRGRLPVPTPELLAEGELEGWPYLLITRLAGEAPGSSGRRLDRMERRAVADTIGRVLRALHGLPPAAFAGLPRHEAAFESARRRLAPQAQRAWGLAPAIVEGLEELLDGLPPLVTGPAVPIHADLHHGNLLVEPGASGIEVRGVIDFGDAALGPPELDLSVPALFLGRGDPEPLDALFAAYGRPDARRDPAFRRRLVAWMFLHPFGNMRRFVPREAGLPARATFEEMERELLPPT